MIGIRGADEVMHRFSVRERCAEIVKDCEKQRSVVSADTWGTKRRTMIVPQRSGTSEAGSAGHHPMRAKVVVLGRLSSL